MSVFEIQSAAQVGEAVEATLKEHLPETLELPTVKEYLGDRAAVFRDVREWQQLPSLEAIATAQLPAVAIVSPGLVREPTLKRSADAYETTWRVAIGIYDRDKSPSHNATQARVRDWVTLARITLLRHPTLGGVARRVVWAGEEYDLLPDRTKARTIGAGALAVDVTIDVPDPMGFVGFGATGVVASVNPTVTIDPVNPTP